MFLINSGQNLTNYFASVTATSEPENESQNSALNKLWKAQTSSHLSAGWEWKEL